jgi:flavin reductase (DIM6/NTAB) family NADH-FMN oxidoreductase RutF
VLYPEPVLIIGTYDDPQGGGVPNAMNAAWGGISEENEISLCLSAEHRTVENILLRKAFTVNIGTADYVAACDYVGLVSGYEVPDKFSRAGFEVEPSAFVDAPLIKQLPMALECRLVSYNPETSRLVGEIVNVSADASVMTHGRIDPMKLRPLVYDSMNQTYHVVGEKVGRAFYDGAKFKDEAQ